MICGPSLFSTLTSVPSGTIWPCAVADLEPANVLGLEPKPLVGLDPDLVGAAELVEIIDVRRAEGAWSVPKTASSGTPRLLAFTRSTSA